MATSARAQGRFGHFLMVAGWSGSPLDSGKPAGLVAEPVKCRGKDIPRVGDFGG